MKPFSIKNLPTIVLIVLGLLSSALGVIPVRAAGPLYVMPGVTGDCSSWANACDLQAALSAAVSGDEIWVAAGAHKPGTTRTATFQLKDGVAVYGGFVGTETVRDQRDFETNVTILSGDIDNNDSQTPIITNLTTVTGNTTNSYHVVTGATGATLDGFTITAGYAYGSYLSNYDRGGGMYNYVSSPTLQNLIYSGNSADTGGGGMSNVSSNPILTNITFQANSASYGGGMSNRSSNPIMTNVTFSGNTMASFGGGMYNTQSSPTMTNVTFSGNSAVMGGGLHNGSGSPVLTNITFYTNSADYGGGMVNGSSNPTLTNVTFSGNSATYYGGGLYNSGNPQILNAIFWGNTGAQIYGGTPNVSDSIVQGGCPAGSTCTNLITTDPLLGPLGDYGGFTRVIPIFSGSSATDTGNDAICPTSDQRGITRPQGAHCDIGAYEYTETVVLGTQIDTQPTSYGAEASFTFSGFSSTGGPVTFECSLDSAAFIACTSPTNYTGLVDGSHTFAVRAKDSANNVDATPASYTWMVDTTAPDTQINSQPANPSDSSDATFTFSSLDLTTTFECSLDGSTFAVCASPKNYTGLSSGGSHTFTVRAKDPAGNVDATPASYTWVILAKIIYATSSGTGDCFSWANACQLQTALTKVVSGDEIWVAAGLYKPTTNPTDRAATFQLVDGVAIYGGFAGTETTRDQRNPATNVTILSGDIDNNDSQTPVVTEIRTVTGNATNSYHVVTGADGATLDGFVITAGYAIVSAGLMGKGGGVYNVGSSPTLTNITFRGNLAWQGGGMYNEYSSPILTNITFNGNLADDNGYGGGISNWYGSSPTLTNVTFSSNLAYNGGGMYMDGGSPTLTNVTFSGNSATSVGGGMYHSGGSGPQIRNAIFWGNTAVYSGAQIYASNSGLLSVSDSVVQDGYEGAGMNIYTGDPKLGALGNYGGFTQTFPLLAGSSAINLGNDAVCPATDQRGVARPQNTHCDIGAYESDAPLYPSLYYVKPAASGTGDCSSWANACTLQTALGKAIVEDEIWAAAGVYKPTTNPADRNAAFRLRGGVAIYGGFAGTETMRNQRNPTANLTILSGEIGAVGKSDNSYHVVITAAYAILDGFTITGGNANSYSSPTDRGGGIYSQNSSSILKNLTISDNFANQGGGMYNKNGHSVLTNITFSNNISNYGGGIYNFEGNLELTDITFSGNSSAFGGGMHNINSSPVVTNVIFSENSASGSGLGGGMLNESSAPTLIGITFNNNSAMSGGGIHNLHSTPVITNVTFNNNLAIYGGGMVNSYSHALMTNVTFHNNLAQYNGGGIYNSNSNPILINVTMSKNSAVNSGGGIYNESANAQIHNTIFWENIAPGGGAQIYNQANSTPSVSDSVVQGGYAGGTNIITANPMLGVFGHYGGFTQTVSLLEGSSATDTGNNAYCPATDQRGIARPQGAGCDIGAFEYIIPPAAFEKLAPTDAEADVSLSPALSWQTSSGATSYEYCYSSAPGPCTKWNSVGSDTSVVLSGLAPNYTYYWQARAVNPGGVIEANDGIWWSFTTINASACTWPAYTPPATPTFGDVPMDVGHWSWVERLANSTITAGCGNGNYCPFSEVVRAQMAIFLLRGKHCGSAYIPPAVGASTGFGDVPLDATYAPWVKQLAAEGITAGCGNGNFCPQTVVNRAQMAIFLLRAKHGSTYSPPAVGADTGFGDVPLDATYAPWVKQLAAEGITAGCGGGNFCPLQNVNRAQMATFLVRAFGLP
jgi:predicted outer membrane repeat protein